MAGIGGFPDDAALSDVLKRFPANSGMMLRLLNDIMCRPGELSRGERELVAAQVSRLNQTDYCVFHHNRFAEAFDTKTDTIDEKYLPLLDYVSCLLRGTDGEVQSALETAQDAGWSQQAIYEAVEVSGIFSLINSLVRTAQLAPPASDSPRLTKDELENSYLNMAVRLGLD